MLRINDKPVVYMKGGAVPLNQVRPGMVLYGPVYGHPHHENGTFVLTTGIIRVDGNEVETRNTIYILHVPGH